MFATIVTANQNTAQFMFLIATILAAIVIVVGFMTARATAPFAWWPPLLAFIIFFIALGLLFHA